MIVGRAAGGIGRHRQSRVGNQLQVLKAERMGTRSRASSPPLSMSAVVSWRRSRAERSRRISRIAVISGQKSGLVLGHRAPGPAPQALAPP